MTRKGKKQTVKHKDQNTFKFKSFSERISEISVDARQNLFLTAFRPAGDESFFFEAYNKWLDLNRTQHFADFQKDVRNKIQSYPMIIHHKDAIVAALLNHLAVENSLALEPILDLTTSLARDLQEDFYPYFADVFRTLSDCVSASTDPEAIEWIFVCFSQLFRILRKALAKDFENVFRLILPLFGHQKEYIVRFATESFAFLVRSYKDVRSVLEFLLLHCMQNADLADGIGCLLFEVVKNVNHHLHSNFAKIFPVLLDILESPKFYQADDSEEVNTGDSEQIAYPVECCIVRLTELLTGYVSKDSCGLLWETFWSSVLSSTTARWTYSLIVLSGIVKAKQGNLMRSPEQMLHNFLALCSKIPIWIAKNADLISDIASDFLTYPHLHLPVLERRRLVLKIFGGPTTFEQKCAFAQSVISVPLYDTEVLPHLLKMCLSERGDNSLETGLRNLISVVLCKDPQQFDLGKMDSWKPYVFDLSLAMPNESGHSLSEMIEVFIMSIVKLSGEFQNTHPLHWSLMWSAAVLLPHFRPKLGESVAKTVLEKAWTEMPFLLSEDGWDDTRVSTLAIAALQSSLHSALSVIPDASPNIDVDQVVTSLKKNGSHLEVLSLMALVLKRSPAETEARISEILPILKKNLRNPSHAVRLISLRILRTLPLGANPARLLDICMQAECVEVSVHQYREKLRFLRMLDRNQVSALPNISTEELDIPLLYLCGCLKIGFQLIWKEVKQLINTYVSNSADSTVWGVVLSELEAVSLEAESSGQNLAVSEKTSTKDPSSEQILDFLNNRSKNDSHPLDAHKYRIQLWQCLTEAGEQTENRNRHFSELFQRFVRNEFAPATLCYELLENDANMDQVLSTRKSRTFAEETMCTMLELFGGFRNPKAIFQEPALRKQFLGLLTYRSPKIQSLTLKVLSRYKWDYFQPYDEQLNSLLDEKAMWNTLTEIEFGAAEPLIAPEHRNYVIPIIIRILFGRMQQKSKRRNTEKGAPKGRKEAIIRSLANCLPDEFKLFLSYVLKPVEHLLRDSAEDSVEKILSGQTPRINMKMVDGILQTLYAVVDELRSVVAPRIGWILEAVLSFLAMLVMRRQQMEEPSEQSSSGGIVRKLRKECYRCLCLIFAIFAANTFSDAEMRAVFRSTVSPEIDSTARDGISTCTPLMRLMQVWCRNQPYQRLMAIPTEPTGQTGLAVLIGLLDPENNPQSASVKLVMECLDGLLNPKENPDNEVTVDEALTEKAKKMVSPFVNQILHYLRNKISGVVNKNAGKISRKVAPFSETELSVACAVSCLDLSAAQSHVLLDVLLPFIMASQLKKEQDMLRLLSIVKLLAERVDEKSVQSVFRQIIPLLSRDFSRDCRTSICEILVVVNRRFPSEENTKLSSVASDLSSWNARHIDEPDFDRRLAAYKTSKTELSTPAVTIDFALLILHMAAFDIVKSNDLASATLRSMGGLCVLEMLRRFADREEGSTILKHLVPILKNSLKHADENVRNEFISILSGIVQYYPGHPVFRHMQMLSNAEDPEADVFENLRHIQKHRVGRAFHRLSVLCQQGEIPVTVMLQYFFPLANVYLCNEQYSGEKIQGLINAVIGLVEAVAGKLQWEKYESMVKHYVNLLVKKPLYQKQIIRVVVAVVDAFHFDLSSVDTSLYEGKVGKGRRGVRHQTEENEADGLEVTAVPDVTTEGASTTTKAKAGKIYRSLTHFMLPSLSKLITDKGDGEDRHKLTADVAANEKAELLRAPVALAMVKLLQKLPERILRRQISGVFLKIGGLLKSRLLSVRQSARETLMEIMVGLGPSYVLALVRELKGVLKRGYQVHVLVHCVHLVLTHLLPVLRVGDLDKCMADLVQLCHNEMFGELAEEKEVTALTKKIAEAKSVKSYDTYAILARFASPSVVVDLIKPIKEKAEETQSHKVAVKLDKALREILSGLMNNAQLTESDLLLLGFALYNPNVGLFAGKEERSDKEQQAGKHHIERTDSYIIPAEPGRSGPTPVINKKSNEYLLQDFALRLLLACFKNDRLKVDNEDHVQKLDPFVQIVQRCLNSKNVTVMTNALRCYIWMLKFRLPSLEARMKSIEEILFVHLKNYSGPGAAVGDNAEFVIAVYKALSASVRDASRHRISDKNLKTLLTFAEKDFQESSKHVLALHVLRAVLSRFIHTKELQEMMVELAKMSIQSEHESLRNQCRQLVFTFLSTYNAKIIKQTEFITLYKDNLEYPADHGRLICMGMLSDVFEKLGKGPKKEYVEPFFRSFAARLGDESAACRQHAAECITKLLRALDTEGADEVYVIIRSWIAASEVSIKRTGLQTCTLFVKNEKSGFVRRAPEIVEDLRNIFRLVKKETTGTLENDHLLINALSVFVSVEVECGEGFWKSENITKLLAELFFDYIIGLLLHGHEWVRIRSLEAFNHLLQQTAPKDLKANSVFGDNFAEKLEELSLMLIYQIKSYSDRVEYFAEWSGCMTYVLQAAFAAFPQDVAPEDILKKEESDAENNRTPRRPLSVDFLVQKICKEAVYEALHEPKKTLKRLQVVKFIQKLCEVFPQGKLMKRNGILLPVVRVVYRCLHEPSAQKDDQLKELTQEVSNLVEKHVEKDAYAACLQSVIAESSKRRSERKRQLALEPVLNPEKHARKRIKKQQTKKETRKKRTRDVELGRTVKRRRVKNDE